MSFFLFIVVVVVGVEVVGVAQAFEFAVWTGHKYELVSVVNLLNRFGLIAPYIYSLSFQTAWSHCKNA